MSAGIYSLPPELVGNVAECLDTEGLLNLRLSSRFLRDDTLFEFVRRYFHERRHIVTMESLECLAAISRHAKFGRAIRTIAISDHVVGSPFGTEKTLADRDSIHESGMVALYLTEVLKNAVNCRTVKISGDNRYWGAAAIETECGDSDWWLRGPKHFRVAIKQSVIAALTESGAPITTLKLDAYPADKRGRRGFQFPSLYCDSCLTKSRWVNTLTTLHLELDFGPPIYDMVSVREFVKLLPQLEVISLECMPWGWSKSLVSERLEKMHEFVEGLYLPRLRNLHIERLSCQLEDMTALLDAHRSTLHKVSLIAVAVYAPISNPWLRLLEMVRDQCLEVKNFNIEICYAVHFSTGFPAAEGTYTIKEVAFEDSDGKLSPDGQVVDNQIDHLIQGVCEMEADDELIEEEWMELGSGLAEGESMSEGGNEDSSDADDSSTDDS